MEKISFACLPNKCVPEITLAHELIKLANEIHTPVDSFWRNDFTKIVRVSVEELRLAVDNLVMHAARLVKEGLDDRDLGPDAYQDRLIVLGSARTLRQRMQNCAALGAALDVHGNQGYFTAELIFMPHALVHEMACWQRQESQKK